MSGFNLDALIAEFGNRYIDQGQTARDIRQELYFVDDIAAEFSQRPQTDEFFTSLYASGDDVEQAFQIDVTKLNNQTYEPWRQRLGAWKLDAGLVPDVHRSAYTGFFAEFAKDPDRSKWGIIEWYIRTYLLPKYRENTFLNTLFFGWQFTSLVESNPTVDADTLVRQFVKGVKIPGNASMDGLFHQICRMNAEGRSINVNFGTLPTDPVAFVTAVEEGLKLIPKKLRNKIDFWWMSEENHWKWREGMREKYNKYYAADTDLDKVKDMSITIRHTLAMGSFDGMWGTPKQNRVKPTRSDMKNRFDVQKNGREVLLLNDWSYLFTLEIPEFVAHTQHFVFDPEVNEWMYEMYDIEVPTP